MQLTEAAVTMPLPLMTAARVAGNKRPSRFTELLFGLNTLVAISLLALIAIAIPHSMADPDIWWHLRNAESMLAQHAFVRQDTFSFTEQGMPWIDHEWLAELPFYLGWRFAGATGVYLVTVTAIEGIFGGLLYLCWRTSRSWSIACAATIIAAVLSTVSFGPRTLLFGWLCLVAELIVLAESARHTKALFSLPLLFVLWINLHGSWLVGLAVLAVHSVLGGVHLQGEWIEAPQIIPLQRRTLLLSWLGMIPALFCNPWGWRLVVYPFDLAFRQTLNIANVQEWQSLDLHSFRGKLLVGVVLLLVGKQLWRPRSWSLTELALLSIGLWSACNYSRFLFLFALLATPSLARSFMSKKPGHHVAGNHTVNVALMVLVFGFSSYSVQKASQEPDPEMRQFPVEAMSALAHLDAHRRIFNEFLWGGYMEWNSPERKTFIDSRVDIFEYGGAFRDYLDIVHIKTR